MPSMGLIGAVGGLGGGVKDTAMLELEEQKAMRLENLRSRNNRETNRLDNDQQHRQRIDELGVQYGYSLKELKEEADIDANALTPEMKNADYWAKHGIPHTQQYSDAQARAKSTASKPPAKVASADYLKTLGWDDGAIGDFISGHMSREQFIQKATLQMADGYTSPEEVSAQVQALAEQVYGPAQGGGGKSFQELFDGLKNANGDKYTDEQYRQYIKQQYGVTPDA